MNCLRFNLDISSDDIIRYYMGDARSISVLSDDGKRVEFLARHLREFVSHTGVQGYFELCFDEANRFQSIQRIS